MKIAVLDFNCNSVDIITVDDVLIEEQYDGEVEIFLTEYCEYNLDMIQWMESVADLNLDMTEKSFGESYEFKWEPEEKDFQRFKSRSEMDDFIVDEIIVCDPKIFGTEEEQHLTMKFYDGYAIEERKDNATPLVLLYPTLEDVHRWATLTNGILEYVQGTTKENIVPHDSALKYGVLYRIENIK